MIRDRLTPDKQNHEPLAADSGVGRPPRSDLDPGPPAMHAERNATLLSAALPAALRPTTNRQLASATDH
jgi:hypothetical protein